MNLINTLVSLGIVKKEDTDLYEYSLAILINYIFFSLLVFLGNLFTRNFITTFLFLVIFFSLRKYSGGLHLESKKICLLFSVFLTLFIPYVAKFYFLTTPTILGLQLVFSLLISLFPIIDTPQKYISTIEKKMYKQKSLLILLIISIINIICLYLNLFEYSMVILFTSFLSLFSILSGFLKYKR